jgi:pimeloyl-ACP methyl ester carboxylesterase
MAEIAKASGAEATRSELEQQMNLPFSREDSLYRYAKSYLAFRGLDSPALAPEVRQPTLVVAGRRDVHILAESSEAIAGAIPGARLVLDDEGDHYAFCRAGSATLEAIAAFLDDDRRES